MRRAIAGVATASAALAFLAGCSGGSGALLDVDDTVRTVAALDVETQSIGLPLDAYFYTDEEYALVSQANYLLIDQCMAKSGLRYFLADVPWEDVNPLPDRRYGIWHEADAASYGYGIAPDTEIRAAIDLLDDQDDAYYESFEKCRDSVSPYPILRPDDSASFSDETLAVALRGVEESRSFARAQPEWQATIDEWWSCLESGGVSPTRQADAWAPVLPPETEAQIQIALVDVSCKQDIGMVQRLADLEARYQSVYIGKNEAALNAILDKRDEVIAKTTQLLARDGN